MESREARALIVVKKKRILKERLSYALVEKHGASVFVTWPCLVIDLFSD